MTTNPSRRDVLTSSIAVAAGAALPSLGPVSPAMANPSLDVRRRIVAAIRDKKITATDVAKAALRPRRADQGSQRADHREQGPALAAAAEIDEGGRARCRSPAFPLWSRTTSTPPTCRHRPAPPALQNAQPARNAPSLQKLLKAGVIMIGKANMHELAFGITSTNLSSFAGPVKNPYDKTRIPGGSSGGTAAAIAAGIVTCGLGIATPADRPAFRRRCAASSVCGLGRQWRRGAPLPRRQHGGPDQPHPRHRRPDGPHRRRCGAAGFRHHRHARWRSRSRCAASASEFPRSFWSGLDRDLEAVTKAARAKLAEAGVVLVDVDMPGLFEQNAKVSFPVALHEPIADIPAYLEASGIEGSRWPTSPPRSPAPTSRARSAPSPPTPSARLIRTPSRCTGRRCRRSTRPISATTISTASCFRPRSRRRLPIDAEKGSGEMSINGGKPVPTFDTMIRNTDPGSNAGIPGLSLFAGMTPGGLPVGLEIDGPVGSDTKLLGLGMSIEAILGTAPRPKV